ncbi:hypothetical protein LINGRAHAP2_LOCUS33027 [Linum grandiflorum]
MLLATTSVSGRDLRSAGTTTTDQSSAAGNASFERGSDEASYVSVSLRGLMLKLASGPSRRGPGH